MRIAVVSHASDGGPERLVESLRELGHEASLLGRARPSGLDRVLRRRGFATPLTQVPRTVWELKEADCDVAHACSPLDAAAALWWGQRVGRPVVLGLADPPDRARLAHRRLELSLLTSALARCDAVVAGDDATHAAARTWLACEPRLAPDAGSLIEVFRTLGGSPPRAGSR